MKRRWLIGARVLFYLSVPAFLVYAGWVLWPLRPAIQEAGRTVHDGGEVARDLHEQTKPGSATVKIVGTILTRAAVITDETAKASTAQQTYFKALKTGSDGLISDARTSVQQLGTAAGKIGGAAEQIGGVGSVVQTRLPNTFRLVNGVLGDAGDALLTANGQMGKIGPLFESGTRLIGDVDEALKNPELADARRNFARISAAWAGTSEDLQGSVHRVTHPGRFGRVLGAVW